MNFGHSAAPNPYNYVAALVLYGTKGSVIINTSYQKLPFGSGDDPDKVFFHQALN